MTSKTDQKLTNEHCWVQLQHEVINNQECIDYATAPGNGAIAMFIGTTRDNFESKEVVRLEYEAYGDMALMKLQELCSSAKAQWPDLGRIVVIHRLGVVPVTEASVVIAVGSPHRANAQDASVYLITELKKIVPIWKKEIYGDQTGDWKKNKEYEVPK